MHVAQRERHPLLPPPRRTARRRAIAAMAPALLAWLCLAPLASPAHAHGGLHTLQVDAVPVGPYQLSVWTGPNELRPGAVLIEALVADPATGAPADGVTVSYTVEPADSHHAAAPLELPAESIVALSERNREEALHIAIGHVTTPGPYRVTIHVADASGFAADHGFDVTVWPDNPWFRVAINVLVVLTVLIAAAFIWHTLRRAQEIIRP